VVRRHHGPLPDMIEVGVTGSTAGISYVLAGLAVTYRMNGSTYTQRIYQGGDACVLPAPDFARGGAEAYKKNCAATASRALTELGKLAPH